MISSSYVPGFVIIHLFRFSNNEAKGEELKTICPDKYAGASNRRGNGCKPSI